METTIRTVVPPSVEEVLNTVLKCVNESQFIQTECHPSTYEEAENVLFNKAAAILMNKWLAGDEIVFDSEEQVCKILNETIVDVSLRHMTSLGVLDSIEDENGELVFWIKDEYKGMSPDEIKIKLDESF